MKALGCMCFSLLIVVSCLLPVSVIAETTSGAERDMRDVVDMYAAASGDKSLGAHQAALADINCDGIVNMIDVMAVYRAVSGRSDTLPTTLDHQTTYLELITSGYNGMTEPAAIASWDDWFAFQSTCQRAPSHAFDGVRVDFDVEALIALPVAAEQRYVATVTADADTVYVSLVAMQPSGVMYTEHMGLMLVRASREDIVGKTIQTTVYDDWSAVRQECPDVTVYRSGNEDVADPVVLRSMEDREAYAATFASAADAQTQLSRYDETFFETYDLVKLSYQASSGGFSLLPTASVLATSDRLMIERQLIVPDDDAITTDALEYHRMYVPVLKDYYVGQPIDVIDCVAPFSWTESVEHPISYETLYRYEWMTYSEGSESLGVIRSASHFESVFGNTFDTTPYDEAYFADHAVLCVMTYHTYLPDDVYISGLHRVDNTLNVHLTYQFGIGRYPALHHGFLLVGVNAEDIAEVEHFELYSEDAVVYGGDFRYHGES